MEGGWSIYDQGEGKLPGLCFARGGVKNPTKLCVICAWPLSVLLAVVHQPRLLLGVQRRGVDAEHAGSDDVHAELVQHSLEVRLSTALVHNLIEFHQTSQQ